MDARCDVVRDHAHAAVAKRHREAARVRPAEDRGGRRVLGVLPWGFASEACVAARIAGKQDRCVAGVGAGVVAVGRHELLAHEIRHREAVADVGGRDAAHAVDEAVLHVEDAHVFEFEPLGERGIAPRVALGESCGKMGVWRSSVSIAAVQPVQGPRLSSGWLLR